MTEAVTHDNSTGSAGDLFVRARRFRPIKFLGSGSMGVVYRVHDTETDTDVALKTLHVRDPEHVYRLKQEFRELTDLSHPNLVELYELVVDEWECFFTMELVDGVNFVEHVRRRAGRTAGIEPSALGAYGPFCDATAQLVAGVAALHRRGKLHRDIKPSNALVDGEGRVKLLDFGLSTAMWDCSSKEAGSLVGTLAYMAPEQAWGGAPATPADWYSVGVVLYEALAGRLPFEGQGMHVLSQKTRAVPLPVRALRPDVPGLLDDLITQLLDPEPARRPVATEIVAAFRAAGVTVADEAAAATLELVRAPFVGREAELARLRAALDRVCDGATVVVRLEAPSGMGKTQLVRRFVRSLEDDGGVLVLRGRCHAHETVPYNALDTLVDGLSRHFLTLEEVAARALVPPDATALIRVFPVLGRVPVLAEAAPVEGAEPYEVRRQAFAGLREVLARIGDRQRLVLWIDDFQWSDADSAVLLREILRPPQPPRMLLIISHRSEDRDGPTLARTFGGSGAVPAELIEEIRLGPLGEAEARELVRRLGADRLESEIGALAMDSAGSPFLLTQLARHAEEGVEIESDVEVPAVSRVQRMLQARVSRLSVPARNVLEVVSVAGQPIDRNVALDAADIGERGRPLITTLERHGFLRSAPGDGDVTIETYHERIREGIVATLDVARLRDRHRRLAVTLEARPSQDAHAVFRHFVEAGERLLAAPWAVRAADRAATALAFDEAAALYHAALDLREWVPAERADLQARCADALVNGGRCADAAPLYIAAGTALPGATGLGLRRRAAEQYLVSGHIDAGLREVRSLVTQVGLPYPSSPTLAMLSAMGRLSALTVRGIRFVPRTASGIPDATLARIDACDSVAKGLLAVDMFRGVYYALLGLSLALRVGEPRRVVRALCMSAAVLLGGPMPRPAQRMLAEARRVAGEIDDPYLRGIADITAAQDAINCSDWQRMLALADAGCDQLRIHCRGVSWELNMGHMTAMRAVEELGEIGGLIARAELYLREAQDHGDLYAQVTSRLHLGYWRWARGDSTAARAEVRSAMAAWPHRAFDMQQFYAMRVEVQSRLYDGEPDRAAQQLEAAWRDLKRSSLLRNNVVRCDAYLLLAQVALAAAGSATGAELRTARVAAGRLARESRPDAHAHALFVRAGLAARRGLQQEATAHLDAAIDIYERAGMVLRAACARHRKGELRGARGRDLVDGAAAFLQHQGIVDVPRFLNAYAPGFG